MEYGSINLHHSYLNTMKKKSYLKLVGNVSNVIVICRFSQITPRTKTNGNNIITIDELGAK